MSTSQLSRFVRDRISRRDVAVHLVVPVTLVVVYVSPVTFESVLFRPGVSGWQAAYLSLVGHANLAHLAGNVFGYLVLSLLSLLLLAGVSRRRFYYASVASILVFVPPLSALVSELYLRRTAPEAIGYYRGAGFSLVVAALVGLLAVAIAIHQRERLRFPVPPGPTSGCLFLIATFVALAYAGWTALVLTPLGVSGLAYLSLSGWNVKRMLRDPNAALDVSLYVSGVLIFLGSTSDLFLAVRVTAGVHPHLVGLVCGFVVVWAVLAASRLHSSVSGILV
ncbi:hypothetical protein ACFOZ7_21290 [Natribaculum luteum]|uniref:Rhomboid family intramembrane serine protease n=1 Tax=Natribaculum luteum TaxID=1586232 RepID=A0ABD5P5J3_9EURY|nr:hypothetical protein [Natribaculum luteum]